VTDLNVELVNLKRMSEMAQVDLRWLRRKVTDGSIPVVRQVSAMSRSGFRYMLDIDVTDRIRLRYVRGRKRQVEVGIKGFVRNGTNYHHDGSIS